MEGMKKKQTRKKHDAKKGSPPPEVVNIRCRVCFMTDGYTRGDEKCRHCGAKIFFIDEV